MKTTIVTCTKCKGTKHILGQMINNNEQLPNYKHNERGKCFTCMGKGTLELLEDGETYLDFRENGNILKYDKFGKYLGIYHDPSEDYLKSKESIVEYMREYIDETEYKKEDLINIEKEFRRIAKRSINVHNVKQCEFDLCDLYNFESTAIEFINWKTDKDFLNKYYLEILSTIEFVNNIKETKMNKELLDRIKNNNERRYIKISNIPLLANS